MGEFVTFEKPHFDFEEEQKMYDETQKKAIQQDQQKLASKGLVDEGNNQAATFQSIGSFSKEELQKIEKLVRPDEKSDRENMTATKIDLGRFIILGMFLLIFKKVLNFLQIYF